MRLKVKWKQWWVALAALLMLAIAPVGQLTASECMLTGQAHVSAQVSHTKACDNTGARQQGQDHGLSCKLACISSPAALPGMTAFMSSGKVRRTVSLQLNNAVDGLSPQPIHGPPRA